MDTNIWRFLSCCLGGEGTKHLFCAAELIAQADAGQANSAFSVFYKDQWFRYDHTPDWSAIAMAATKYLGESNWLVLALSSSGALWELYPKGPVESLAQIPQHRVGLTNLATLGDTIAACGMGRVCCVRDRAGRWTDISAPWPSTDEGVIGFTALAGSSEQFFYAVGWQGEIWARGGGTWQRQDSPSNANLNAIVVADNGAVCCVGDHGAMIRGAGGAWDVIETGSDANLVDVCIHDGQLFTCSESVIFRLTDDGLVEDFAGGDGEDVPRTALKLVSDGRVLYSVGPYDVFRRLADGWERLA